MPEDPHNGVSKLDAPHRFAGTATNAIGKATRAKHGSAAAKIMTVRSGPGSARVLAPRFER